MKVAHTAIVVAVSASVVHIAYARLTNRLLALALRALHRKQLLKFALAAVIEFPLCFALAALVRRLTTFLNGRLR